jgi:hypothetical protein
VTPKSPKSADLRVECIISPIWRLTTPLASPPPPLSSIVILNFYRVSGVSAVFFLLDFNLPPANRNLVFS